MGGGGSGGGARGGCGRGREGRGDDRMVYLNYAFGSNPRSVQEVFYSQPLPVLARTPNKNLQVLVILNFEKITIKKVGSVLIKPSPNYLCIRLAENGFLDTI